MVIAQRRHLPNGIETRVKVLATSHRSEWRTAAVVKGQNSGAVLRWGSCPPPNLGFVPQCDMKHCYINYSLGGGLAQLVATLVRSTQLVYAGPG